MNAKVYSEDVANDRNNSDKVELRLQSFQEFQRSGRSSWRVTAFNVLFCGLYCPYYLIEQYYLHESSDTNFQLQVGQIICLFVAILCCWIVLLLFHTDDTMLLRMRHRIKSTFILTLGLFFSLNCFLHLLRLSVDAFDNFELVDDNEAHPQNLESVYVSVILLLIIPFAAVEIFRETNQYTIFSVWAIITLTILFLALCHPDLSSILVVVVFLTMSILVILDRYSFEWSVFEYNAQLELQIEKYTMERRATEMRDMIGNVAHDLKTPLTSFMTATELIRGDLEDFAANTSTLLTTKGNPSEELMRSKYYERFQEFQDSVQGSLDSIRDIHSFMLMVINRCLDYRKASVGIDLLAAEDIVDVEATMQGPVQCMLNIQQKIGVLGKTSLPEGVRWIKTDRQWLQENLLCIVSNAVKHSNSGTVELEVSLQPITGKDKIPGKIVDEIRALPDSSSYRVGGQSYSRSTEQKSKPSRSSVHRGLRALLSKSTDRSKSDHPSIHKRCERPFHEPSRKEENLIEHDDEKVLLFEVRDCSHGLSSSDMERFFNPFKQKRLSGGTGLGLYSLAKRVEALGGQYGVHRRDDGVAGSVVWFSIPYVPADYRPLLTSRLRRVDLILEKAKSKSDLGVTSKNEALFEVKAEEKKPIPRDSIVRFEKESKEIQCGDVPCILIVEDAPTIAKMTKMMLSKQSLDTDIAENGKIALEKVIASYSSSSSSTSPSTSSPARKYAAVLMDFQMPEMDGIEATKRIREYESQHGIECPLCIIGISAMSDSALIEEGKAKGMTAFVPKPFANKDFMSFIKQL